jgi:uncharacterized small protein (DUF1192 family)
MADDIVTRPCCDVRPCGCADARTVIDHLHAEIERLTKQRDEWQATAAGLSQDISNAEDEIERLRGLIIEWDNAEQAADAVFSGPETVVADRRLSKAMDNLIKEARRG